MLIDKVRKTIRKHRMFPSGGRVVVAVSGGPDSVCLLRALRALAPEFGLTLHVAHLDHRFRGAESAAEAEFVRSLAAALGIPATVERIDVPSYCADRGLSSQAGAREVRYQFLERVAREAGAQRIALGHTANDQAETVLMRLIRGAGLSGLSGIPPMRDEIVRPLIDCTRGDVIAFLQEVGQDFRTDPSNLDPVYTRNRIRGEVLPVLERLNPQIVETLAAEAAVLRDEDAAMEAKTGAIADRLLRQDGASLRFSRQAFQDLPSAYRRRVLRTALERVGGAETGLPWVRTEETLAFIAEAQTGRSMELPGGLELSREYDDLVVGSRQAGAEFRVEIAVPGTTAAAALGLEVSTAVVEGPQVSENENNLWQAQFDYDTISLPLRLRSRLDGDRFQPAGMAGTKKLQDYFTDEKVPQARRGTVPLLATRDDVLWVVGMRLDGRFLPGPGTKRVLTVTVRRTG